MITLKIFRDTPHFLNCQNMVGTVRGLFLTQNPKSRFWVKMPKGYKKGEFTCEKGKK